MENQELKIENDLQTVVFEHMSGVIRRIDNVVFKIVIDYIIRNFDPTGINIVGLVDSVYHVLMKPKLSWFYKVFKPVTNHHRELAVNLPKASLYTKSHATKVSCC